MYPVKFTACIAFVIREEGGFVNDPKDPGGATRYGISIRSHRDDIGDIDRDGDVDADDVRVLSIDRAIEIYHDEYWSAIHGDELPIGSALVLLDTAVNCGVGRAIRLLQRAGGLDEDGILGAASLSFARTAPAAMKLLSARRRFYQGLKTFTRFGNGWMARLRRLELELIRTGGAP